MYQKYVEQKELQRPLMTIYENISMGLYNPKGLFYIK